MRRGKAESKRSITERRVAHNIYNTRFGGSLSNSALSWLTKVSFEGDRQRRIVADTSHQANLTPPGTPSATGDFPPLREEDYNSDFSGDDNITIHSAMSDNLSDLNYVGERSEVPPFQSSTFIQNLEGSAVPAGNQEVNLGRGVNEEHNIIFNPLAPPTGFGRLSGGVMYPLPNTSSPEGFPSITSSPKVQTLPVFTKTVRGFDTPDLVNTSLNISTRPMLLIEHEARSLLYDSFRSSMYQSGVPLKY